MKLHVEEKLTFIMLLKCANLTPTVSHGQVYLDPRPHLHQQPQDIVFITINDTDHDTQINEME